MDKHNPQGDQIGASPIFKKFLGKAEEYLQRPTRVKQLLNDAYQKASDKKDIGSIAHEAWETLQTLFRLIRASVSGEYTGLPTTTVVAAVAVTLYFLSPIDFIPDFIPIIGLLDDIALVAWFSTTIKEEMDKFSEWEQTRPAVVTEAKDAAQTSAMAMTATTATAASSNRATIVPKPVEAPAKPTISNTDSGLGSPESSNTSASESITDSAPKPDAKPRADVAANTTDSSRSGSGSGLSGGDSGGNVR